MEIEIPKKHLTDKEFYSYIKLFEIIVNEKEFEDDNSDDCYKCFSIKDLCIGKTDLEDDCWSIFNRIYYIVKDLNLLAKINNKYNLNKEIEDAIDNINKKPEKERKELLNIINKIKNKQNLKIENISNISWVWYGIYSRISFSLEESDLSEDAKNVFKKEIDTYLECLIDDKLPIIKKNYYKFEKQKEVLIRLIEEDGKIKLYGNNFIIKEKIDDNCVLKRVPDFCLIQTLYALQKLNYIKVVDIWEDVEYGKSDEIRYLNTNIILEDIFIDEINVSYKKENPKNYIESFDDKTGILKFAGIDIELSKKGKETDAVLLLRTLLAKKDNEWIHNDEMLDAWGYNDEDVKDIPKNKVYFACQKVNNVVALKTKVDDFLEFNTSKTRINPKYKRVDE